MQIGYYVIYRHCGLLVTTPTKAETFIVKDLPYFCSLIITGPNNPAAINWPSFPLNCL